MNGREQWKRGAEAATDGIALGQMAALHGGRELPFKRYLIPQVIDSAICFPVDPLLQAWNGTGVQPPSASDLARLRRRLAEAEASHATLERRLAEAESGRDRAAARAQALDVELWEARSAVQEVCLSPSPRDYPLLYTAVPLSLPFPTSNPAIFRIAFQLPLLPFPPPTLSMACPDIFVSLPSPACMASWPFPLPFAVSCWLNPTQQT